MQQEVAGKLQGPAIGLIVTAGIGSVFQLLSLGLNVLGTGIGALGAGDATGGMVNLLSGGLGILINIVGLLVAGFIVYGALQMKNVSKYSLSVAAAVVAMIPCLSPCCFIGLPVGIWALVVLLDAQVKQAFVD